MTKQTKPPKGKSKPNKVKKLDALIVEPTLLYSEKSDELPRWFPKDVVPFVLIHARNDFEIGYVMKSVISSSKGTSHIALVLWMSIVETLLKKSELYNFVGIVGYKGKRVKHALIKDIDKDIEEAAKKLKINFLKISDNGKELIHAKK